MAAHADQFSISTRGKGTYEITERCQQIVRASGIRTGMATVFVQHTSASLVIYENADPSARTDLHSFLDHLVPEDTPYFVHTHEGPDDMPSRQRMAQGAARPAGPQALPPAGAGAALGRWRKTCSTCGG